MAATGIDGGIDGGNATGGGGGETTPPTDSAISPTPNQPPGVGGGFSADYQVAKDTPVVLQVVDAASTLGFVKISVKLSDRIQTEEIYAGAGAATGFVAPYQLVSSISGSGAAGVGYTFSIRRNDGWPRGVSAQFNVKAVDSKGNVL